MDDPIVTPHGAGCPAAVINKQSWPVILALVVGMVLLWATCAAGATTLVNVKDYGATAGDSSNDTAAFEKAMSAAGAGEIVYVPVGTYRLSGVNIPSNTTMQLESGAVLKKFSTANGPLLIEEGPTDSTFAQNIHIEGVNGRFLMDLNDAGQETPAIRFSNVKNFSLRDANCKQNWDNHLQEPPSSRRPCLSFKPANQTKRADGTYNAPTYGVIENATSMQSPYGWGLAQLTGGSHLDFINIASRGGVPLRLENYSTGWTPMSDIYANGVTCTDGHDAIHMNPHGAKHPGPFEVHNVTVDSCESAISIGGDGSYGANASVDNVNVTAGSTAHVRDPADTQYVDAWLIGDSRFCIDDKTRAYSVKLTNVRCGGLPNTNK